MCVLVAFASLSVFPALVQSRCSRQIHFQVKQAEFFHLKKWIIHLFSSYHTQGKMSGRNNKRLTDDWIEQQD